MDVYSYHNKDRRKLDDRRVRPTNSFSLFAHRGRRKTIRRQSDRKYSPCADQYGPGLLLVALLLILLCVGDGLFTIMHVSEGKAVELNPLMDILLKKGPFLFFGVKFVLSAFGTVVLVLYRHNATARNMICAVVFVYGALFCYQVFIYFS